jgi:hypothetical protein
MEEGVIDRDEVGLGWLAQAGWPTPFERSAPIS